MAEENIATAALAAEQLNTAVRLRARGATWPEVADRCGFPSPAAAFKAVGEAMAAATMRAETTADQMRNEANLRLEYLLGEAMRHIDAETVINMEGEPVGTDGRLISLRAIDESRRLVESLAKLNKLDKTDDQGSGPIKVQVVGIDPSDLV